MSKLHLEAQVKALKEGEFEVVASTGQQDRMGDKINVDGWYLKNYKKNPVILWAHDSSSPPIAKAIKTWVENKKLMVKGLFAPTPFAQELRALVEEGFLNTVSVGFLPLIEDEKGQIEIEEKMYRRATDEEVKDINKGVYREGEIFKYQELLEVSWVDVPALPTALVTARELGLSLMTKALEKMSEDEEDTEEDTIEVKDYIDNKIKETLEIRIAGMEEAIFTLKDIFSDNPEISKAPSKVSDKGRTQNIKKKSRKSDMERLLITFDKFCEILLKKLRQESEK
jgi:phage head maturation protease